MRRSPAICAGGPADARWFILRAATPGAFFRFTDIYSRMTGGQMTIAMDPPLPENPAQQGILNVRNFAVHDETQARARGDYRRAAPPQQQRNRFLRHAARIHAYARARWVARTASVRGPILGGTIDGWSIMRTTMSHLRGTLVSGFTVRTTCSGRFRWSVCLWWRQGRLFGINLRSGRPTRQSGHARQSDYRRWRRDCWRKVFEFPANGDTGRGRRPALTSSSTGLSKTCRFLPNESLINALGIRSSHLS